MKVEKFRIPLMAISLYLTVSTAAVCLHFDLAIANYRYFTNLSNLFMGVCALVLFVCTLLNNMPRWVVLLFYIGTCSLFLTMMTVLLFLAPMNAMRGMGYFQLFEGIQLLFHLINPLAAILMFMFLLRLYRIHFLEILLTLIPVVIYGLVYAVMIVSNTWPDFYGFTFGGRYWLSPIVLIVMWGATYGLGALLRLVHNRYALYYLVM